MSSPKFSGVLLQLPAETSDVLPAVSVAVRSSAFAERRMDELSAFANKVSSARTFEPIVPEP